MASADETPIAGRPVAVARLVLGVVILGVLGFAYVEGGDRNPFDFFGYFTNLTSLLIAVVLVLTGILGVRRRPAPALLTACRAVATACLIIVAVVYNVLVPGTGSAPPWVSVTLHAVVPVLVLLDWVLIGDRRPLRWSGLWLVLPYPAVWITVVLIRGATDGWVPYGFLLPEHGVPSLIVHVAGLLAALTLAGTLVWWASRYRGRFLVSSREQ
ncbi:hypothetical protein CLV49_2188 [Labedella gwakjiensis]|uniref:FAR-17a/AIG1-like protein n=1 Tax=Labedella gwakjiensis TaxID=390269 RepID=A0A2P8GX70_9MICO|nr:Pr6Pr family membrane protein [Labedella gwakjiensis]PSL38563.1 hypothetical protein CLV49_2188 [Labedella gwakjiensis]RUQ86930.1 hypothetical protein ELQ93_08275 [Labedella gwakjiensis]